jgi:hypothetical protein
MFGIAGYVAEVMWRDEWFDDEMDMTLSGYACLSDTDKRACGPLGEPLERAARRVGKLFDRDTGKLWPDVLRVARQAVCRRAEEAGIWQIGLSGIVQLEIPDDRAIRCQHRAHAHAA